ncbi:MAG: hypothetical protein JRI25_21705 [Deltaproteobacteria bacterium]|nr:hypothetical protein [Deltaproteobacteria bacterium]
MFGAGTGTVASPGGEIDCPGTCEGQFPSGSLLTLTATPDNLFNGFWANGTPNNPTSTCGQYPIGFFVIDEPICGSTALGSECNEMLETDYYITTKVEAHFQ